MTEPTPGPPQGEPSGQTPDPMPDPVTDDPSAGPAGPISNWREAITLLLLSFLLFSAVSLISVFGLPLMLFAPVPLAILGIRQGEVALLMAAAAGMALTGALFSLLEAGGYLMLAAIPALLVARGLAFGWKPERIVGIGATLFSAASLGVMEATIGLRKLVEIIVADSITATQQADVSTEFSAALARDPSTLIDTMLYLMPVALFWFSAGVGAVSLLATGAFISRTPDPAITVPDHTRWHLPDHWIWLLIGAGVLVLIPTPATRAIGGGLLGILAMAYAFQGWAVVAFLFNARNVHPAVRFGFYMSPLLGPISLVFAAGVMTLGVFDVWTDVRELRGDRSDDDDDPEEPTSGPADDRDDADGAGERDDADADGTSTAPQDPNDAAAPTDRPPPQP